MLAALSARHVTVNSALTMARQWGHMNTRPRRGRVDTKFTRVRNNRATLSVLTSWPQRGQIAGYSRVNSASLSRDASPSSTMDPARIVSEGLAALGASAILVSVGTVAVEH